MARPRKPTPLRVISGSRQPDAPPLAELPAVRGIPKPPDWLPNAHAVKEFERLAPILHANKLLTEPAIAALGHLCALHGSLVQQWAAGLPPTGHMIAQYRALINDFGLTPVAQGKVKPVDDGQKANKFAGIGKPAGK